MNHAIVFKMLCHLGQWIKQKIPDILLLFTYYVNNEKITKCKKSVLNNYWDRFILVYHSSTSIGKL